MVLTLSFATLEDVERVASIHLAAFDVNPLLHVQFPSPSSLAALKSILCHDMLSSVQQGEGAGKVVLLVRDSEADNSIISFAKWDLPSLGKDVEVHPEVSWPPDCRIEYLDGYHQLAEAMKARVIGDKECYRMTFVGTDPKHQGRGAATMLTKWGLDRAEKDKIPIYLESTMNAVPLYQKLGFISVDKLSFKLPGTDPDGNSNIYEELGMLRTW